jgi:hypothetical protein
VRIRGLVCYRVVSENRVQTLGLNGSPRPLDCLRNTFYFSKNACLKFVDVMANNGLLFQHVGHTEKESRGEWCNIAWKTPHTSEMRNLMVGGPEKPLQIW